MSSENPFDKVIGADKLATPMFRIGIALITLLLGYMSAKKGVAIPVVLIALPFLGAYLITVFRFPYIGILTYLVYVFFMNGLNRYIKGIPFGLGAEGLLLLTTAAIFFQKFHESWYEMRNTLTGFSTFWFIINILEIGNPHGPSPVGWFYEARSSTLNWFFITPLGFLLLRDRKFFNAYFNIILVGAMFSFLWGLKHFALGCDPFEERWLDIGNNRGTHVLFGKLRVFGFYSDAGQFGASQAHVAVMFAVLAMGKCYSLKKRLVYFLVAFSALYGMLISGTRGAFFVIIAGGFMYLVLTKNIKILVLGGMMGMMAFGVLKFTSIGSGNAQIQRMRTALDPEDASFQVRLRNQKKLRNYLSTRPFGTGVGTIGAWGEVYNSHMWIAHVPPDSLFVKQWAMYGIIGLLIWLGILLYLLGRVCGYVWRARDDDLKQKNMAFAAGFIGVIMASYGNEVMNMVPTGPVIYFGMVFTFLSPRWEAESNFIFNKKQLKETEKNELYEVS